jgi:hypothetical protein
MGLLEHLGEVILDSQDAFERIDKRLPQILIGLKGELQSRAV